MDPTKLHDWQIAEEAEKKIRPIRDITDKLGLLEDEVIPYGKYICKVDFNKIWNRIKDNKTGKMVQAKDCPFTSGVLVAGMGDEIPKGVTKKSAKKPETKAVKPKENK